DAFGRGVDDVDCVWAVEEALGSPLPCKGGGRGWGNGRTPPARPLRQVALLRLRAPHAPRAELHRQPVNEPRQFPLARRFLDQAFLSGTQLFRPLCRQREGVEAEVWIERRGLVGE